MSNVLYVLAAVAALIVIAPTVDALYRRWPGPVARGAVLLGIAWFALVIIAAVTGVIETGTRPADDAGYNDCPGPPIATC